MNDMRAHENAMLRKEIRTLFAKSPERLTEKKATIVDSLHDIMTTGNPVLSLADAAKRLGISKAYLQKIKPALSKDSRFRLVEMPKLHKNKQFISLAGYHGRNREMRPVLHDNDLSFEAEADAILGQLEHAEREVVPKNVGIWSNSQSHTVRVCDYRTE